MRLAIFSKRVLVLLQGVAIMLGLTSAALVGATLVVSPAAEAASCSVPSASSGDPIAAGAQCSKGGSQATNLFDADGIFIIIANTLIFLVGAISVIYLIIAGLRYVTSGGDAKQVTQAKDTILYAVIGIVVAVISFAVVNFVITALGTAN